MPKAIKPQPQTYVISAHTESGEVLQVVKFASWRDVTSLIAAWTRQMALRSTSPEGEWDENCYIQIHPNL